MSKISWTFSLLENGLHHLAGLAEDGVLALHLDMHPLALMQMTASEFLTMLERRAAEEAAPAAPPTPEPPAEPESVAEEQAS